jgi:mono/diheme cytochrome c family protein
MLRSIALSLLLAATATSTGAANNNETIAAGERDYETYCASCHGLEAKGDGPVAEFLALTPADLTQLAKRNGGPFPAAQVAEIIDGRRIVKIHGPRDMPVWGDWFKIEAGTETKDSTRESMVQSRIRALVAYLESVQER